MAPGCRGNDGGSRAFEYPHLLDSTDQLYTRIRLHESHAMPGLGTGGYLTHIDDGETMIDPEALPDIAPVDLECERGDIVLMNRFTPHSSTPNRADYCRWSIDLRFQTTGHHTGRTAHPAFIVRSADDASVMNNYEQWCDNWLEALKNPRGFAGHRIHQ
jgi:phytanoyl-CoA hydroxylase